jgi:alkanesulfonate monooxygenase SsuD/methylene tetrahydromethanopterin reductase-like flavin-dependent oxidoreductase (luciferase family)
LAIVTGLWRTPEGERTPKLTALYADEYNVAFRSMESIQAAYEQVTLACERYGRTEPGRAPLVFSVAMTVTCGRTEARARARAERVGWKPPLYGTPDQVVDVIGQYAKLGATRLFLQIIDLHDLDHLDLIAGEVMPQVA